MKAEKQNKVGRPKKLPTFKPSLRCRVDKWKELQLKYPGKLNAMFNQWLETL